MTVPTSRTQAYQQGPLLLLWGALPFALEERPPANPALVLNRLLGQPAATGAPLARTLAALPGLPPLPILSLDASRRLESAFAEAGVPYKVVASRRDVPSPVRHSLLKLAGDLESRSRVVLSRAGVRDLHEDEVKRYLLRQARSACAGGTVLLLGCDPASRDFRAWWAVLAPALEGTAFYALGEPSAPWPEGVTCLETDLEALSTVLWVAQPAPEPKPPEGGEMNTITWLHLSDFHFRASEQHVWNENIVLDALLEDVRGRMTEDGLRPDFVVVSGDLAFSGQPAEYDLAGRFFDDLLQATGLGKERLFLVPGNHDVDRRAISRGAQAVTDALDDRDTANAVLSTPGDRRLVLARFQGCASFVNGYLAGHLPFDDDRYYYVKTLDLAGQRLALLGLNSAWVAASDQDKAQGLLLGERQTRTALREADGTGATLKLALLHHPLDWLREFDQNDSGALLLDRCHYLLHGHLHQTATAQLTSPDGAATILACGACYKTRESPNMYNWVRLDLVASNGTVYLRRYSDARGGFWAPDTLTYRNVTNGEYTFALRGQATAKPSIRPSGSAPSAGDRGITGTGDQSIAAERRASQGEPGTQDLLASLRIDADDPPYAALRALLLEAFSPDDLRRFCQERSSFRPVLSNIGAGASPNEIIDALFELCRTRLRWDELLAELVKSRPEQVAKYADRLCADSP
jgi:hypothetical protein